MPNVLLIIALAVTLVILGMVIARAGRGRASGLAAAISGRRRRVLLEDALKHLHDVEYRGLTASVESLAGALDVPADLSVSVVAVMEADQLIERQGTALRLTADGRIHARRIVRIHRLWEKWLAEETGVDGTKWHAIAEKREHDMTDEEAEQLAARLGYPAWDPHGDPIPTADGKMPPWRGAPLPSLTEGDWAVITHLEDEPVALYQEIAQAGLHPGTRLRLLELSATRVRLMADGRDVTLTPVAAANVTVTPLADEAPPATAVESLASLTPGESARVTAILPACLGAQRRRLLDLGLVPGTDVTAVMSSASGNPTAYRIRGSLIALRHSQARWVGIERGVVASANTGTSSPGEEQPAREEAS